MGLDMYLTTRGGEEVCYWRKVNAIHFWFVQNVQDGNDSCRKYRVTRRQLESLLVDIVEVLDSTKLVPGKVLVSESYADGKMVKNYEDGNVIENPEIASQILPTCPGFFFGGTDYDEWYWESLARTRKTLNDILSTRKNKVFYYQSSW